MNKEEVVNILLSLLKEREEVVFAILFGSVLEGEGYRDVDIAIYLSPPLDPLEELKYKLFMEVEGERALGVPLDVKILNSAPYYFAFRVLREGEPLLVRDSEIYTDFIERTSLRYMDEGYIYRLSLRELEEALADG